MRAGLNDGKGGKVMGGGWEGWGEWIGGRIGEATGMRLHLDRSMLGGIVGL